MKKTINEYYQQYEDGLLNLENLKGESGEYAYSIIKKEMYKLHEDDQQEIFLEFFKNFDPFIYRYDQMKKSYSSYISMTLHFINLNFQKKKQIKLAKDITSHKLELQEFEGNNGHYLNENSPRYQKEFEQFEKNPVDKNLLHNEYIEEMIQKRCESYPQKKLTLQKRILLVLLKGSTKLTAQKINDICSIYELNKKEIDHYILLVNIRLKERLEKYNHCIQVRNAHFSTLQILRYQFSKTYIESEKKIIENKIEKKEEKLKNINIRIEKFRIEPSNKELSEITKIPKGTIDSIFMYLSQLGLLK